LEDFVKKSICCFFIAFIAAAAWTQEPLVPKRDFSAVPGAGQSELIFENKARDPILVSINGSRAAHLFPGEITKIIVNNGKVSIEAQTYTYNNKRGWRAEGKAAWLIINPDSQSIKLQVNNNTHEDARIILRETIPLQTQNSGTQVPNVYSSQERIAVFPFEVLDNAITVSESVQLYRNFSNQFTNISAGRFNVVPRQDVEKLLNMEARFQLSDFSARTKTAEMERVLNGTQILIGLIGKAGSKINVSVSLYTYPDLVQLPGGADLRVANRDELFDKIPELVQSMQNTISSAGSKPTAQSSAQTGTYSSILVPNVNGIIIETDNTQGGRSTAKASLNRETIEGKERMVLNMEISLNKGAQYPWGCIQITDNVFVEKAKNSSGIRFKVYGDGKKWFLEFATGEAMTDYAYYRGVITTRKNQIITVNIPYNNLGQPDWGKKVVFNKNSIFQLQFASDTGVLGTSSLKVFDIEFY